MMVSLTLYLKEIRPVLSQDELDTLIEKSMENDREAINKIVEHNLGLVVSIAKKCNNSGIPILDLIEWKVFKYKPETPPYYKVFGKKIFQFK